MNKISYNTKKAQIFVNSEKVTGLKLLFQWQNHDGHMGARKFWHEYLPTLQYYNPALKIDLLRLKNDKRDVEVPCKIEILGRESKILDTINMQYKKDNEIMDDLLLKLDHEVVPQDQLVKV